MVWDLGRLDFLGDVDTQGPALKQRGYVGGGVTALFRDPASIVRRDYESEEARKWSWLRAELTSDAVNIRIGNVDFAQNMPLFYALHAENRGLLSALWNGDTLHF